MAQKYPAWVNGRSEATLSVSDRAVAYGDGVFETIRVAPKPVLLEYHLDRLETGCSRLNIPVDRSQISEVISLYLKKYQPGLIKLIVSRGSGGRGYAAPETLNPSVIVQGFQLPQYPAEWYSLGVNLFICETPLCVNPKLQGIKHLNRLEQVLARNEFDGTCYQEGLMADQAGSLIEGTMSNLFYWHNQKLYTPSLDRCAVQGTMQRFLMESCQDVTGVIEQSDCVTLATLKKADEAFVCNSVFGIWPIKSIMNQCLANKLGSNAKKNTPSIVSILQEKTKTLFE